MPEETEEASAEMPLPPANFSFLVSSLLFQAQMELGLLHWGEEKDRPAPNLSRASHAIDMLAMLQEKTQGNLSLDERRLLENGLTEIRFRYVQVSDERRAAPEAPKKNAGTKQAEDGPVDNPVDAAPDEKEGSTSA